MWLSFIMLLNLGTVLGTLPSATPAEWSPPVIKHNSRVVLGTQLVVTPGSPLVLRCEGDGAVNWQTRLAKYKRFIRGNGTVRTFRVERPKGEHTGTYKCFYSEGTAQNRRLFSAVHVYVKDPNYLFTISSSSLRVVRKEGDDYLLPCLLTNPEATHLSLRMDNGTALPPGMNFTADPRKGILIHNLHPSYNADYVCTARVNGQEEVSKPVSINVIQKLRFPPYVFLEKDEYIRLVGEKLKIRCTTHNPNFNYNVTWRYSTKKPCTIEESVQSKYDRLDIESILTYPAVELSDTGNITCIGTNEAGANSSTTYLLVVDDPYIRLTPQLTHHGLTIEVNEGEDFVLSVLIEAYPQITVHGWETPTPPNPSSQERKFTRFNNRWDYKMQ